MTSAEGPALDGEKLTVARIYWQSATQPRLQLHNAFHNQPYAPELAKHARAAIEPELYALQESVAALQRTKNSFQPIAGLPPEILAIIFSFLVDVEPNFYPDIDAFTNMNYRHHMRRNDTLYPRLGWIKISHVSHHWRQVALAYPRLWSNVTFSLGLEWTRELIERSKDVPILLDIWLYGFKYRGFELNRLVKQVVQKNIHRTHTIHVADVLTDPDNESEGDIPFFSGPAPLLHTFRVFFCDEGWYWPSSLLAQGAPRLRDVFIDSMDGIPWKSPLMHNLTRLFIKRDLEFWEDNYPRPLPMLEDVLNALRQSPHLEHLAIHGPLPGGRLLNNQLDVFPPVPLFHLSTLVLGGYFLDVAVFLKYLRWNPITMIQLEATAYNPIVEPFRNDTSVKMIREQLAEQLDRDVRVMRITSERKDNSLTDEVAVWRSDLDDWQSPDEVPNVRIKVERFQGFFTSPDSYEGPSFGGGLHRVFPLESLRTLVVTGDRTTESRYRPWKYSEWRDAFGRCTKLLYVHAQGFVVHELLRVLIDDQALEGGTSVEPLLFPELVSLSLLNVAWSYLVPTPPSAPETLASTILEMLVKMRARGPRPLQRLHLDAHIIEQPQEYVWAEYLTKLVTLIGVTSPFEIFEFLRV